MYKRTFLLIATLFILAEADIAGMPVSEKQGGVPDSTSVTIFFKVNESVIDRSYMGNGERLNTLKEIIPTDTLSRIISVVITATSSPEGNILRNKILATERAAAVEAIIQKFFPDIDPSVESKIDSVYNWKDVRTILDKDPGIPYKERLLAIVDNPYISNATKESEIRALGGGSTYNYLKYNILNHLRIGGVTVTIHHSIPARKPESASGYKFVLQPAPAAQSDTLPPPRILIGLSEEEQIVTKQNGLPIFLKSNLLFDLAGALNLGVEFPIGKHLSVGADAAYSYWRINNLYALQTIQGGIGAKYWFNQSKRVLTGWNAGVYGMYCSRYDVQWGNGHQGDGFWSAGVSAGYSVPISNKFNLEFAIAGGYLHTPEVRSYSRPEKGHLMWTETRYNVGRVSLTKIQVNLVWLIGKKEKGESQ